MQQNSDINILLDQGLSELGIDLNRQKRTQLQQFLELIQKWNRVYNLTAVKKPEQMVSRHILDSLVVLPYIQGQRILDVGTGAGLPGIPLAICMPEKEFVLLDSNRKKTRFVQQAITELGLENATVIHKRAEEYLPDSTFDVVITRAYSALENFIASTRHCCAPGGSLLAMKGVYPVTELEQLPADCQVEKVESLQVPYLDAERHLIILKPAVTAPLAENIGHRPDIL